jgi:hypothetical protein
MQGLSQGDYGIAIFSAIGVLLGLVYAFDIGHAGSRTLAALRGEDAGSVERTLRIARSTTVDRGWFLKWYFSTFRGLYWRMPDWIVRAFGVYAIAFSLRVFFLSLA